jgi:hypothetical protein
VLGLAAFFAPIPPVFVEEYYSRDLYPWLQRVLTTVSNLVPLAVLDLMVGAVVLLALYRGMRLAMNLFTDGPLAVAWEAFRRTVRALGLILLAFTVLWGWNYRRTPLEETLGELNAAPETVEALQALIAESNVAAARLRSSGKVDANITFAAAATELTEPMGKALDGLSRTRLSPPGRPKSSVLLSPFFTLAGVNGVLNPFVLESVVHPELLPIERPFVLAHEWAHLAGHGNEAEASAIGWFACMKGGPTLAYSASVYLIMEAGGRLPEDARRRSMSRLDPGVYEDIRAISRRMLRQNATVQRAAARVYEQYLQANGVDEGLASYGLALRLIMSTPFREALTNYGRTPPSS